MAQQPAPFNSNRQRALMLHSLLLTQATLLWGGDSPQAARSHPRLLTVHSGLSECRSFWRLYNVQRFWTSPAERFEKSGGCQVKAE